ncbi:MAG TPA: hypothetical protein VLT59_13705, partial [Steroidobacteraceae bacterium]|nr:hypothetical protein [Steroidobacteraceae bacterium]
MKLTVQFNLEDEFGNPVELPDASEFEFYVAKFLPATDDSIAQWQNLVSYSRGTDVKVLVPSSERGSTDVANATRGDITRVGSGVYEYTFATDLDATDGNGQLWYYGITPESVDLAASVGFNTGRIAGVMDSPAAVENLTALNSPYDPDAIYRVVIVSRDGVNYRYNAVADFVPSSGFLPELHNLIVTNESCGACHGDSENRAAWQIDIHGDRRYNVGACEMCHNPSYFQADLSTNDEWDTEISFYELIHRLHAADPNYFDGRYAHMAFPLYDVDGRGIDIDGDGTEDGEFGKMLSCRACHDNQRVDQPPDRTAIDQLAWQSR